MSEAVTVRVQESGKVLRLLPVRTWKRGDLTHMVMSTSSGPKDYLRNQIFAAFESDANIRAIALFVSAGVPVVLIQRGEQWADVSGAAVQVEGGAHA
jgi:hypothetical protein